MSGIKAKLKDLALILDQLDLDGDDERLWALCQYLMPSGKADDITDWYLISDRFEEFEVVEKIVKLKFKVAEKWKGSAYSKQIEMEELAPAKIRHALDGH